MAKKNLPKLNPLGNIQEEGFIGYVPEEDDTSVLKVQKVPIEKILDSPYQTREQMSPAKFAQLVHSIKTLGFQGFIPVRIHPEREGYYQIVAGGHSRRSAAKVAGEIELPIVVVDFDERQTALGTALENIGREDLNVVEKGKLFLKFRQDFNLSQEDLAKELGEDMSRNQIKECEAAATSALDIQEMLVKKEGGIRAAKYLRQLDKLDIDETGRAMRERASIIEAFLNEELTTDGIRGAVQQVLQKVEQEQQARDTSTSTFSLMKEVVPERLDSDTIVVPQHTLSEVQEIQLSSNKDSSSIVSPPTILPQHQKRETRSHEDIERTGKIEATMKRFQQFKRLIGDTAPSEKEREILSTLLEDIQFILRL